MMKKNQIQKRVAALLAGLILALPIGFSVETDGAITLQKEIVCATEGSLQTLEEAEDDQGLDQEEGSLQALDGEEANQGSDQEAGSLQTLDGSDTDGAADGTTDSAQTTIGCAEVVDDAELMTSDEISNLQNELDALAAKTGWQVYALTTSDARGMSAQEYADDFVDTHAFEKDGVCYLIDMDNREVYISTTGIAIRYLTDDRIDSIIDDGYSDIVNGDYAEAFIAMARRTKNFYSEGIYEDQYNRDENGNEDYYYPQDKKKFGLTPIEIIIALFGGAIAAIAFVVTIRKTYQLKYDTYHYDAVGNSKVKLTKNDDRLVNQFVTHRHIPTENRSSSGGGGGHVSSTHHSSGGGTHGGGGRSF